MAKGDIVRTKVPLPELVYAREQAGSQARPGDAIIFNAAGDINRSGSNIAGPVKILTHLVNSENGSRAYMLSGEIEAVAGGNIHPNDYVVSDNTGRLIARTNQTADRIIGIYKKRVSDEEGNASNAAAGAAIIVRVTAQ